MTYFIAIFGVYLISSSVERVTLQRRMAAERKELNDRIMALTDPNALMTHKAYEETTPAYVTYVDEKKEAELNGRES